MNTTSFLTETTAERVRILTAAWSKFSFLGPLREEHLLSVIELELGHAEILDGFRPYGSHFARAIPPRKLLHIVSGNTPHAALQSLVRGLLLGSHNYIKLPTSGLPEVDAFVNALPETLASRIETSTILFDAWLHEADAVIVFGSDETIAHFRARVPAGTPFQAHGHRISLGIIFEDPNLKSVKAAARDISICDQQGCLSPHDLFIKENKDGFARAYAARLAEALEEFDIHTPRRPLSISEAAAITDLRTSYSFRSANDVRTQIWESEGSTNWTVIFEEDPWFATSPLNRVIFVKPLPVNLASVLEPIRPWLGAIGIWPATLENAECVTTLGAARICELGRMQIPPITWHAEGLPNLGSLVRWIDFDTGASYIF